SWRVRIRVAARSARCYLRQSRCHRLLHHLPINRQFILEKLPLGVYELCRIRTGSRMRCPLDCSPYTERKNLIWACWRWKWKWTKLFVRGATIYERKANVIACRSKPGILRVRTSVGSAGTGGAGIGFVAAGCPNSEQLGGAAAPDAAGCAGSCSQKQRAIQCGD